MIAEFLISTIIVGITGSVLIYSCKSSKKKMEEELNIRVEKLEKIYMEERVKNNDELEKLRKKLDDIQKEYSSAKVKKKKNIL